ncbi:MAG: hypothetical protein LBL26_15040 [Peptococcaceae bacterium]|nr:hypothetical protein [Peptococcaceae bacterium]
MVNGQFDMHSPQSVSSIFSSFLARAYPAARQARASKNASLSTPGSHKPPRGALPGHISAQIVQFGSQLDFVTGVPQTSGALVHTTVTRIAEPASFVTSIAFLPIQPAPDNVAAVFCGNNERSCRLF